MMERLLIDDLVHWAVQYKVLHSHHSTRHSAIAGHSKLLDWIRCYCLLRSKHDIAQLPKLSPCRLTASASTS